MEDLIVSVQAVLSNFYLVLHQSGKGRLTAMAFFKRFNALLQQLDSAAQAVKHLALSFKFFKAHKLHVLEALLDELRDWVFKILEPFGFKKTTQVLADGVERV